MRPLSVGRLRDKVTIPWFRFSVKSSEEVSQRPRGVPRLISVFLVPGADADGASLNRPPARCDPAPGSPPRPDLDLSTRNAIRAKTIDRRDAPADPANPANPRVTITNMSANRVADLFIIFAPLEEWRRVEATDRHAAVDYAKVLKDLSDVHFLTAEKIVLVQGNLSPIRRPRSTPPSPPRSAPPRRKV